MRARRSGFTLTELLVVVLIVTLVSAVALPTVIPALTSRQVGESARILQAALAGARDAAIRANAPRGVRLLPDLTLSDPWPPVRLGQKLVANRIVPIEPAPDLTDPSTHGSATFVSVASSTWSTGSPPAYPFPYGNASGTYPFPFVDPNDATRQFFQILVVAQAVLDRNDVALPIQNPPTNWFWNVRIGDRFRFNDSGRYYTVIGPMTVPNPEGFVNDGNPGATPTLVVNYGPPAAPVPMNPEFLFLVNGLDDDGDGYPDNGFNGVDENGSGAPDEMGPATGLAPSEWHVRVPPTPPSVTPATVPIETETWLGTQAAAAAAAQGSMQPATFKWTIARRPVPSPGAREVSLAGGAVVDLTTWDQAVNERSRLPVDPFSGAVDVLVNQAGQVVPTTYYSNPASSTMGQAFYHFWLTDTRDVVNTGGRLVYPTLPVMQEAGSKWLVPASQPLPSTYLTRERVLLTLFARTGQVVTNSVDRSPVIDATTTPPRVVVPGSFDYADANLPYEDAQLGLREAK